MKKLTLILTILMAMTAVFALPDLTVDDMDVSLVDPAIADSNTLLVIDLANNGNETANMFNYTVSVDNSVIATRTIPVFADNSATTHNIEVYFNQSATYNVTVSMDPENTVTEEDETNNDFVFVLNVEEPVMNVTMNDVVISGVAGQTVTGVLSVQNVGNDEVTVGLSSTGLTGNTTIGSSSVQFTPQSTNLAVGQTKPIQVQVTIPSGIADGAYVGTLTGAFNGGADTSDITLNVVPPVADFKFEDSSVSLSGSWNESLNATFTINNTGSADVMVNLSETVSDLDLVFDQDSFLVQAGASRDVLVTLAASDSLDAETYTGTIRAEGAGITKTIPVTVELESKLSIYDVDMIIDGDTTSINEGDNEKVSPDEEIEFEVVVKNLFTDDENVDIRSIDVKIEIDPLDDDDWDDSESESVGKLDPGERNKDDDEKAKFSFKVDSDVRNDDKYQVLITATGTDDNDVEHEDVLNFTLEIDREEDELTFETLRVTPDELACDETSIEIEVEMKNTGSNDQNNIELSIENSKLGIDIEEDNIDLDEGDKWDDTFTLNIDEVSADDYTIIVKAKNDDVSETETLKLTVKECGSDSTSGSSDQTTSTGTTPGGVGVIGSDITVGGNGQGGAAIAEYVEEVNWEGIALTTVLVLAIVGFIGLGIFLVMRYW